MVKLGKFHNSVEKFNHDKSEDIHAQLSASDLISEPLSFEDYQIFYNLLIIKISTAFLMLKFENMDEQTLSQFSNIEKAISELTDQLTELLYKNQELIN